MEREELQTRETVERMREREEEWRIYTWTKIYIYIYNRRKYYWYRYTTTKMVGARAFVDTYVYRNRLIK